MILLWPYILWLADVFTISVTVALFEIVLEKDQGWASGLSASGLGRKLWQGSIFVRCLEKPYLTIYHLLMFGLVLPLILAAQCWVLYLLWSNQGVTIFHRSILTIWRVGHVVFAPYLFCIAAWLAICLIEDFLWFAFNWHYPASLHDLLSGNIWWHTRWVRVGTRVLPRFYLLTLVLTSVILSIGFCSAANVPK